MRKYPRIRLDAEGQRRVVGVVACNCLGIAMWQFGAWTPGSRGPAGGLCEACDGAVRSYAELVHDMESMHGLHRPPD